MQFGYFGQLRAQEGRGSELLDILLKASLLVKDAKGCSMYIVSVDSSDTDKLWVYEVWDSKEDHANSLNIEAVRNLIGKAIPLLKGKPERGIEMEIKGGLGISH